jgi:hypothetical protein
MNSANRMIGMADLANRIATASAVLDPRPQAFDADALHQRAIAMIKANVASPEQANRIVEDADARTRRALTALATRSKDDHGHQALAGMLAYATLARAIPVALGNMLDGIEQ